MRYVRRLLLLYQGFVLSGAILIFSVPLVVFVLIPGIQKTRDLFNRLTAVREEVDELNAKFRLLSALDEENVRERLIILLSGIPQDKSVSSVLGTIDGLAQETGVSIIDLGLTSLGSLATVSSSIRPSVSEKKIGASGLPFTLTASGAYENIRSFVGKVNKVRRLFDVTSFDLSIGDTGVTQARLSLTAYYQPLPAKVASIQSPVVPLSEKEESIFRTLSEYPDVSGRISQPISPVRSEEKRDPFTR
jgi:Tfp pilus assembly protein PilO